MVLASKCNLNPISLNQLRDNKIFFHNNLNSIALTRDKKIIAYIRKS